VLDLRFIRDNAELVKRNCAERNVDCDVDGLVELIRRRSERSTRLQEAQRDQNEVARQTKSAKDADERAQLIEKGKALKAEVAQIETELARLDDEVREVQLRVPNLTHPDAPRGPEDVVLRTVGSVPHFDFPPLDHVQLCEKHGWADFESAAKVTGSSFYFLKGEVALLQMALAQFAMNLLAADGFTPVITPDLARLRILDGTGYIPRGPETQIYTIAGSDLGLIATAEITLAGMLADETLEAERLPLRFAGLSHCFRTEAGAHGRATRGLFRVHQFTKVEMFAFTVPEQSEATHQQMLALEERIFGELEIPYRVIDIRTGDLGGPAYRKYDLEAWMPGRGEYAEVTSTSNCTDYQARRLNIRCKRAGQKGTQFVHMLNGTAIAASRAIIAVLENHQQADGSVRLPAPLARIMGKPVIGAPA
jgi:seryl-tRNA synthetase